MVGSCEHGNGSKNVGNFLTRQETVSTRTTKALITSTVYVLNK